MANEPHRLRLHSVEHFMLADSRRSHPMTFFLRVELAEELDMGRLREAFVRALRFHPLLVATVALQRGRWYWKFAQPGREILPLIDQHEFGQYDKSRGDWSLDLCRRPGLRISVAEQELWLQVHHSCCDARGLLDFVDDLREQYASPWNEAAICSRVAEIDQQLPQRAIGFSASASSYCSLQCPKLSRIGAYFWHRSRPLMSTSGLPGDSGEFRPTCIHRELAIPSKRPSSAVPERGTATVNDLLLQAMFEAMAEYQKKYAPARQQNWMRIGMPIDMRQPKSRPTTACNGSSLVFLDRRPQQILTSQSAWAAQLERETQHIKQERLGVVFFDCLEVAHRLPWGMKLAVADRRCAVTSVLSNLGRLHFTDVGEATAEFSVQRIDFLPPLRPGTRLALGVATIDNRLSMSLHYDARHIMANQATEIIDTFIWRLAGKLLA